MSWGQLVSAVVEESLVVKIVVENSCRNPRRVFHDDLHDCLHVPQRGAPARTMGNEDVYGDGEV